MQARTTASGAPNGKPPKGSAGVYLRKIIIGGCIAIVTRLRKVEVVFHATKSVSFSRILSTNQEVRGHAVKHCSPARCARCFPPGAGWLRAEGPWVGQVNGEL